MRRVIALRPRRFGRRRNPGSRRTGRDAPWRVRDSVRHSRDATLRARPSSDRHREDLIYTRVFETARATRDERAMQDICSIKSLRALGLLWIAIGSFPSSALGKGPLALCLNDALGESDACETENCRVEACKSAAEKGHAKAIVLIGMAHVYGKAVQEDHVTAYMYFRVLHLMSVTLDEREQREAREYSQRILSELGDGMSTDEISRAETLAREWMTNHAQEISDLRMRRRIERALVLQGFSTGRRDGEFDRKTREAIQAWQRAHGHAVTGELTDEQTALLLTPQSPCDSLGSRTAENFHGSIFFPDWTMVARLLQLRGAKRRPKERGRSPGRNARIEGEEEGAVRGARSATPVGRSRSAIRVWPTRAVEGPTPRPKGPLWPTATRGARAVGSRSPAARMAATGWRGYPGSRLIRWGRTGSSPRIRPARSTSPTCNRVTR